MKKCLILGMLTILLTGCVNSSEMGLDSITSLNENTKAYISLKTSNFEQNIEEKAQYQEVVVNKLSFYNDYVKLKLGFKQNEYIYYQDAEKKIQGVPSELKIIPVLVDKSWLDKGLKVGSVLRTRDERVFSPDFDEDSRYYIVGFLENAKTDGLYFYTDNTGYRNCYGSCGRTCHYFEYEIIEYK